MERQFPKNVRQIGNVCDEPKIYVEDYVDTYLNQLRMKAMDMPVGAVFTGEIQRVEEQDVVYISGALQMKDLEIKGTDILVGQEVWEQAEKEREEYFPELKIVGWCLVETGHPMGLSRSVNKIHGKVSFSYGKMRRRRTNCFTHTSTENLCRWAGITFIMKRILPCRII